MHARGAASASAGVNGRRLISIDAHDGLEPALLCRQTFAAGLAPVIVDSRRDHRVEAAQNRHVSIGPPSFRRAALLIHHGTVTAHQCAQSAAVASFFVDDRRFVRVVTFHDLGQATLL